MINFKLIYKVIGSLLFIEVAMMLYSLCVSIYYKEDDIMAFIISIAITILTAIALKYKGYHAETAWAGATPICLLRLHG